MTPVNTEQFEILRTAIRDIPDFPKAGIVFKDITPLLKDPKAFKLSVDVLEESLRSKKPDVIVGIESRGFIFSPAIAYKLQAGFVPLRKKGKLPYKTEQVAYDLEYGEAILEIHKDAIEPGARVAIVDDLLATGGTAAAAAQLVEKLGGTVVQMSFVIELAFLKGREKLSGYDVFSILQY
ncbi:MAG: adenine phosphoribosyltransferase [Candidatus Omnitrophota bacterium]|jgi:adenine phosphoribosyltransferase